MDALSLLFGWMTGLASKSLDRHIMTGGEKFATRALIKGRVESCIGKVVDSLAPFFRDEKLSESQKLLLVQECERALSPLVLDSSPLLAGSLNGEKIYEQLYSGKQLPQCLRDERLEYHYSLLFPRIAHLVCRVPGLVEQWQKEGWSENFRRLDDLADVLGDLTHKVDEIATEPKKLADELLGKVRRALLQRVSFRIDLTGLRGDKPEEATMEQMFVLPELLREIKDLHHLVNSEERNIEAFLKLGSRTIVKAGGGAGKSTWTAWLQQRGLTCTETVVIVLRLRDWSKNQLPSKDELIREAAGQHLAEGVTADEIRRWIKAGALAFLIDGFDEVKPVNRDLVMNWLVTLSDAVEECPVLITSRPLTTNHLESFPKAWKEFSILPFDESRVRDYIARWYRYFPGLHDEQRNVDLDKLADDWQSDSALSHLTGNPLMLATLLMVHHLDGSLPRGRSALYRRYIDGMLGLWDDRRKLQAAAVELRREDKKRLLTRIALRLHLSEQEQIDEENLLSLLDEELHAINVPLESRPVLDALRERTGLLVGPGTYGFVHKSVAEYLIAEALDEGNLRDDDSQVIDRARLFLERHHDRWSNILFFWAGLARVADLEGFLEMVNEESGTPDWLLLAGLLYDASDRLHLDSFRERYGILLRKPLQIDRSELSEWSVNPLCEGWDSWLIFSPEVRGPQRNDLNQQLREFVTQRKLDWDLCAFANPSIYNGVWVTFISSTPDFEQLLLALEKAPAQPSKAIPAPIFAISWLGQAWSASGFDYGWYTKWFLIVQNWAPEFAGYAPVCLLANLTTIYGLEEEREAIATFEALLGFETASWEAKWLNATRRMEVLANGAEYVDFLVSALHIIRDFKTSKLHSKLTTPHLDKLEMYVNDLIIRRDGNLDAVISTIQA